VPDDDFLTIGRGEHVLLGFRKTRSFWRGSGDGRNREQHRSLLEKQHDKAAKIDDRREDDEPFQNGHQNGHGCGVPDAVAPTTSTARPTT
jgi:hypothetical protein